MKMQNLTLPHMYSKMLYLNNWDVFHKPAEKDFYPGRKGGPVMMRNTRPLSFRKSTVVASIRVWGGQPLLRGFYDNPTLRAMHSIHKCVAKGAPHLLAVLRNEPRYS